MMLKNVCFYANAVANIHPQTWIRCYVNRERCARQYLRSLFFFFLLLPLILNKECPLWTLRLEFQCFYSIELTIEAVPFRDCNER